MSEGPGHVLLIGTYISSHVVCSSAQTKCESKFFLEKMAKGLPRILLDDIGRTTGQLAHHPPTDTKQKTEIEEKRTTGRARFTEGPKLLAKA